MIRTMRSDDAVPIGKICQTALGHRAETVLLKRRISQLSLQPAYYITVYERETDKAVLGFLQAQKYDLLYGQEGWNIIALAVAPEAQGRGIGRQLITALEDHVHQYGGAFIRLNSRAERIGAHAFYTHLGYTCDKSQKRFIKYLHDT